MAGERFLSSPVLEANANQGHDEVRQLFAGLPVDNNANFELLSPVILGETPEQLREQILSGYQVLVNIKKSFGRYDIPEITTMLAIALLNKNLYELVKQELIEEGQRTETGRHESGHITVAKRLGWSVSSATAEERSGVTFCRPPAGLSLDDLLVENAAICLAGQIAAQMMGDDGSGSGSDLAKAQALAEIATSYPGCKYTSVTAFLAEAHSIAHQALSGTGQSVIEHQAINLAEKGPSLN